ncbi:hypothetical protein OSB04_027500 [Centaurea solstitialis]|uniref:Uncharacterized protein n=1 Tax=Centaurea solstitialis TaxID=347529 RepID=A0AA38W8C5_9ASTR|nr:hypothetical protein OSB04_027500 [Centaurea solstitialis]
MATFTTIALDRLIEPKASKSMAAGKVASDSRQGSQSNDTDKRSDLKDGTKSIDRRQHWTQISPALYATPEPTPLPDSPSSFAPSPYIVNHKRRGPRLSKAFSEDDVAIRQAVGDEKGNEIVRSLEAEDVESSRVVKVTDNDHETLEDGRAKFVVDGEHGNDNVTDDGAARQDDLKSVTLERDGEMDDFFDPQDSLSVRSSTDGESSHGLERSLNLNSSVSEFYDAWEELSSESGSQSSLNNVETELREMRLCLLMEMEKRKQAEERLNDMQSQWGRMQQQFSVVGLNLPSMVDDQFAEELSVQVDLLRFVSNCIGRAVGKAEVESEMEAQLESKNFEISRLLDKVRYNEAVNRELSRWNQETMETMRQRRQRRKRRQRWIWGSVVAAVTVGSAAIAWSYTPAGKGSSSSSHTSSSDDLI